MTRTPGAEEPPIMDSEVSVQQLKDQVQAFCDSRDWDPFHGAKDLAIGAVTEAAELLEPFRFLSNPEVEAHMQDAKGREHISQELADVLFFLLRFSQRYELPLAEAFFKKMEINAQKYPVQEFRGQNRKARS